MCPTLPPRQAPQWANDGPYHDLVLILSNISISLLKRFIPDAVRIPAFIVVIASFVTILELLIKGYLPALQPRLVFSFRPLW